MSVIALSSMCTALQPCCYSLNNMAAPTLSSKEWAAHLLAGAACTASLAVAVNAVQLQLWAHAAYSHLLLRSVHIQGPHLHTLGTSCERKHRIATPSCKRMETITSGHKCSMCLEYSQRELHGQSAERRCVTHVIANAEHSISRLKPCSRHERHIDTVLQIQKPTLDLNNPCISSIYAVPHVSLILLVGNLQLVKIDQGDVVAETL